jgi:hypothetical protein
MSEQINVTQNERPQPPPPTPPPPPPEGPGIWVILGAIIGALLILLLVWAFWLQPSYFPQVPFLSFPPTTPQIVQPPPAQPAPDVNIQGGSGGTGGTGGSGGSGGSGGGSTPSTTTTP